MGTKLLPILSAALICSGDCVQIPFPQFGRVEVSAYSTLGERLSRLDIDLIEVQTHKSLKSQLNDLRVARFAARLYYEGFGRTLVCTGGTAHQGDLLATNWQKTEAEITRTRPPRSAFRLTGSCLNRGPPTRLRRSASPANCCAVVAALWCRMAGSYFEATSYIRT
jgi:hypothetical protein